MWDTTKRFLTHFSFPVSSDDSGKEEEGLHEAENRKTPPFASGTSCLFAVSDLTGFGKLKQSEPHRHQTLPALYLKEQWENFCKSLLVPIHLLVMGNVPTVVGDYPAEKTIKMVDLLVAVMPYHVHDFVYFLGRFSFIRNQVHLYWHCIANLHQEEERIGSKDTIFSRMFGKGSARQKIEYLLFCFWFYSDCTLDFASVLKQASEAYRESSTLFGKVCSFPFLPLVLTIVQLCDPSLACEANTEHYKRIWQKTQLFFSNLKDNCMFCSIDTVNNFRYS